MSTPLNGMDDAALLRFVSGESPRAEREAIERWIATDVANGREVSRLARAWELTARPDAPVPDASIVWRRLQARLDGADRPADPAPGRSPARPALTLMPPAPRRRRWLAASLKAAVVVGIAVGAGMLVRHVPGEPVVDAVDPVRTYTTRPGERAELRLTDGSRVVLGGATSLRIAEAQENAPRDVWIDGEAYFDVARDAARAFRVHTPRAVAEDLGTRFLVTAYSSDDAETIAVAEGIVALTGQAATDAVVLHANDVGQVTAGGAVRATRGVDVSRYLAWMDGVARFEDERLGDAVRVIERQFGVRIRITDSALARRRVTGSIRASSLYADLRGLALLIDARYERRGEQVTLAPPREPVPSVHR